VAKARKRGEVQDDRGLSLGWYCRKLLLQEIDRGVKQTEIATRTGLKQATISQIKDAKVLPTLQTAIALAEYFRRTPGELVNEAIDWWTKRGGREESIAAQDELWASRFASDSQGAASPGGKARKLP
jgi:DNA-binding XRE family transcriptional regulator